MSTTTGQNAQVAVAVEPAIHQPAAYMPPPPRGSTQVLSAHDNAITGAVMATLGMEEADVSRIYHLIQANAVRTSIENMTPILETVLRLYQRRMDSLLLDVQKMRAVQLPAAGMRGVFGSVDPNGPFYVNLDEVLRLITVAQARPPR